MRRPALAGGLVIALGGSALAYADAIGADGAAPTTNAASAHLAAAQVDQNSVAEAMAARANLGDSASAAAIASRSKKRSVSEQERSAAELAAEARGVLERQAAEHAARTAQADAAGAAAALKAQAVAQAKSAAAAKAKRDAAAAAKAQYDKTVAAAKANPQAVAASIAASEYGWGSGQMSCLTRLWTGESNWRWWAENSSSGAYGIPQALPARKMAQFGSDYRTNPATQIKWGLWYIKMSYGSPCSALNFWNNRYPHWY